MRFLLINQFTFDEFMERGLLWLPLLAVFFWLTWAGWNEYAKLEAYRQWASQFEQAKYDIYAVLGHKGGDLTWGKPTRRGPVNLQTFSLQDVVAIRLLVGDRPVELETPAKSGRVALEFLFSENPNSVKIPFTDSSLAVEWGCFLRGELKQQAS